MQRMAQFRTCVALCGYIVCSAIPFVMKATVFRKENRYQINLNGFFLYKFPPMECFEALCTNRALSIICLLS